MKIIILKNNIKISGENEKTIYNSIEEQIITYIMN